MKYHWHVAAETNETSLPNSANRPLYVTVAESSDKLTSLNAIGRANRMRQMYLISTTVTTTNCDRGVIATSHRLLALSIGGRSVAYLTLSSLHRIETPRPYQMREALVI